jgi:glycosyltransferase involved in cell wall biosynthesis
MPTLLVHGWRGINHSFSLVNQFQISHLADQPALRVFHEDAPYLLPSWSAAESGSDFPADIANKVSRIPNPNALESIDAAYSITFPHVLYRRAIGYPQPKQILTFMVTEFGVKPGACSQLGLRPEDYTSENNLIITPSQWSALKLVEGGFRPDRIAVIPHGVEQSIFHGVNQRQREFERKQLDIPPDAYLFLNLGAMTANKGVKLLIQAFGNLRLKYPHIRLMLKDNRNLYGLRAEDAVKHALSEMPHLANDQVVGSIRVITKNLTPDQLSVLYRSSDCYVSPYYAEGFNLPVIEAAACETPVIVTRGGPTDDFCPDHLCRKIDATLFPNSELPEALGDHRFIPGHHLVPSFDSLVAQMEESILGGPRRSIELAKHIQTHFSWKAASEKLASLITGVTA